MGCLLIFKIRHNLVFVITMNRNEIYAVVFDTITAPVDATYRPVMRGITFERIYTVSQKSSHL